LAGVGVRSCEQFKALLLHYACGLAHKDVASLLGTRKETINARLQEGRLSLKSHYIGRHNR
jgi:DNA-directed RNA polymerase specialized sigma24 family protein